MAEATEPFVLLKDPATYRACRWDMREDDEGRAWWIAFFKKHVHTILDLGFQMAIARDEREGRNLAAHGPGDRVHQQDPAEPDPAGGQIGREPAEPVRQRMLACVAAFDAKFDAFNADPQDAVRAGPVTILTLDEWRDELLREHGFIDPFADLKERENAGVLPLLSKVCRQLDASSGTEQFRAAVEGVFAGNIFDMGAAGSAQLLLEGKLDFFTTRKKLPARPWLVDQFDAFAEHAARGWRKAVFFVDNAGSDFMLGAVPFMRMLARRGTRVVLATNERPTLNDMTFAEVSAWWPRMVEAEPSLAGTAEIVSTGTGEPLIDLAGVSPELNAAAAGADLVVMEGMGRGVESNLDADFVCDAANLAMLKDPMVAKRLGGKLYDVVCRFR